jgi:hypothetical protein
MPEMMNCPKCGVFNTKCGKCDAKVCLACFIKNAESQKCSLCGAMVSVQPLPS